MNGFLYPKCGQEKGRKLRMSPVQRNGKLKTGIKIFSETMKQFLSFVVPKLNLTYRIFAC